LIPFSLVNILISLSLKETVERRSPDIKKVLKQVDPGGRCSGFIKFIGLFCLAGFSIGITWAYVIPLYLKSMGLTVEMIGALLGLQSLASGFTLYILSSKIEYKGFLLFSGAYSSAGIVLFGLADRSTILPLSFMLGTASGAMGAVHEAVIGKITREGSYGADIGLLMLGLHAGNTVAQAVSGYLISYLGYSLLFCLSALASLTFSVLAYLRISKNKKGD
jgi:predicted MFS family arabinose efflux permease